MPTYTFLLFRADGSATTLDAVAVDDDGAAFARAGVLLDEHLSCDYVEVWETDRGVAIRHREQPILRPARLSPSSGDAGTGATFSDAPGREGSPVSLEWGVVRRLGGG